MSKRCVLRRMGIVVLLALSTSVVTLGQVDGRSAFETFLDWRVKQGLSKLSIQDALEKYEEKLKADGVPAEAASRTVRLILAHDEGTLYDRIFSDPPSFSTKPNRLLVEAVAGRPPGRALDVGMGQGRNALYLASQGWDVSGFDVANVGMQRANEQAAAQGLKITTVLASDEEFDFGNRRWDLIAIIYAIKKRSIHRVRDALKPGGVVVVEAGHADTSKASFEYESNELLQIFQGFRILHYEDTSGTYDWGPETIRLVRLVAEKPTR